MPRGNKSSLFYELPQPACVVSAESMGILDWNAKADEMFGLSSHSPGEITLLERIQAWDKDKFLEAFAQRRFDSPDLQGVTAITLSGTPLQLDLLVRETKRKGKTVFLVVCASAGPRVQMEEQLRQAQKMESVGMLAGGIAHDFNNLLTIISGYSHLLASSLNADENNRFAAEQVIKASDRAAALTRQLLSFSRRQVAQNKVLDLNAIVHGVTPMLNRLVGEHIRLQVTPGLELGRVRADSGQLEQVIMNLVVNARDAMPEGGSLRIETRNAELNSENLGNRMEARPGPYVLLAVSDSGIGMDTATCEKIFEPFFTTKSDGNGTGLGLSMVYNVVKRCGGTVDVVSEPGQGTAIKIYLPRAACSDVSTTAEEQRKPLPGSETLLLVEDDEAVRNIVSTALSVQGYQVLVAPSAEDGLELAKLHRGTIDLLITDMVLPKMNGREMARRFHKKRPGTAVLFMSGYTDVSLADAADPEKQVHFIGKPFTPCGTRHQGSLIFLTVSSTP